MNDQWPFSLYQILLRRLLRSGVDLCDAEDALHDAFERLLQHNGVMIEAETEESLVAWVLVTARRRLIDEHRHKVVLSYIVFEECECEAADTYLDLSHRDGTSESILFNLSVRQAWHGLTDADREVLQLKAHGNSVYNIAIQLHLTEAAAEKRLQRARTHFQAQLTKCGLEELFDAKRVLSRTKAELSLPHTKVGKREL